MTEINRCYKLTAIRAPEIVDIEGLSRSFFEPLSTITEITDLRITFKVEKNTGKEPNRGEVAIYNLASSTRDEFVKGPTMIRLEAGYDNTPRLLFLGDLRYCANKHEGNEWITKLQLGDGARAYREARANKTYAPGTPVNTIVGDLAKAFGVALPAEVTASPELQTRIAAGEAIVGDVSDELTRLLAQFGFEWSFQNGRLQIVRFDAPVVGVARVISQETGMIGSPTMTPPRISAASRTPTKKAKVPKMTVQHLLYPEVAPAERIDLRSLAINGTFRLNSVTHEGDTDAGGEWLTTMDGVEV